MFVTRLCFFLSLSVVSYMIEAQHCRRNKHDEVKRAFMFDHQSHKKFPVGPGYTTNQTNFSIFFFNIMIRLPTFEKLCAFTIRSLALRLSFSGSDFKIG